MNVMSVSQLSNDSAIIKALRTRGYKATSQRIAICRFAFDNRDHPTAENIYREVKRLHPTVSLSTVYNTLQVQKELHLVQELAFAQSETRIDSNIAPHVNVVCLRCGSVSDLDDRAVREVVARTAARTKFTATGQRFDIYGICEKCGRKRLLHTKTTNNTLKARS